MPNKLSFVKREVNSDNLLPLKINRETLQESKIIKVIYNKLVRKAIEMLHNLAEKEEYKRKKDKDIHDDTKEVEIKKNREVVETDNDKLFLDAANDNPPPKDALTTTRTMTAAAEKIKEDDDVGAEDGNNDD